MIELKIFEFNHFSQNTFLLYNEKKECIIIDPGCFFEQEKETLKSYITDNNLSLSKVLYTHCHLDHSFGANYLKKEFGDIEFWANEAENIFIQNAHEQANRFKIMIEQPPALNHFIKDGDIIEFGDTSIKAILVPGHSPGSLCYYFQKENFIIVGDVLFQGSIGRTDLLGGNYDQLIFNIKNKLLSLPPDCKCYPGHGPYTTIGDEKQSNPFLY